MQRITIVCLSMANFFLLLTSIALLLPLTMATSKPETFSRALSLKACPAATKSKHTFTSTCTTLLPVKNPTAIPILRPTTNSSSFFGTIAAIDDLLTLKPELASKQVGRAQGIYVFSSLSEISCFLDFAFVFTEGKFNGSSLIIMGKNTISLKVREMPVVGGSGVFRFARGYAEARTQMFNAQTGDAIVEYDVYVFHN